MNIIFKIGISLLASSFIMVAYVCIRQFRQIPSGEIETQENDFITEEEELIKEDIRA